MSVRRTTRRKQERSTNHNCQLREIPLTEFLTCCLKNGDFYGEREHTSFWSLLLGGKSKPHLGVPRLSNVFSHCRVSPALFVNQEISQLQRTQTSKSRKWIWGMGVLGHWRETIHQYQKIAPGGGVVVGNFLWFVFFVSWGFFFFFRSYVYYRMQIRIRYLQIILKAHIVLLKDTSILAYHFMKSFISQTNHCFISC